VATGLSSLLWGALITSIGFSLVFVVAAGFQVLTIVLSFLLIGSRSTAERAR
jgi:hypothetical protein